MPGSSTSLGSLTSPSPSPPPTADQSRHLESSGAGLDGDSELSELTDEEQEGDKHAKRKPGSPSGSRVEHSPRQPVSRAPRKKRSSIVPAPMWGWATTAKKDEDDQSKAVNSAHVEAQGIESRASPLLAASAMTALANAKTVVSEATDRAGSDTVGEPDAPAGGEDTTIQVTAIIPSSTVHSPRPILASAAASLVEEPESEGDDDEKPIHIFGATRASSRGTVDAVSEDGEVTDEEDESRRITPERDDSPESDSRDGGDLENLSASRANVELSGDELEVDITAPPPNAIQPLVAAAAHSSIMYNAEVIRPPSPTSSNSSASDASRSPSPEPTKEAKSPVTEKFKKIAQELSDAGDAKAAASDIDLDAADVTNDRSVDDIEVDVPSPVEDVDVELESDLQPAHRAEALDVLAIIELKFAQLRERIYVEKMEALSWEEELVEKGIHPELIHLHKELSKRRDRRLELATRRREQEGRAIARKRRLGEDATWSWWHVAKDELQTEMIAETNGKRRRLERDRRLSDRPPPDRPLPSEPLDAPLPPTLRNIAKSSPLDIYARSEQDTLPSLVYPELATLSAADISSDMEFLSASRSLPLDAHRPALGVPVASHFNPLLPNALGLDAYPEGVPSTFNGRGASSLPPAAYPHAVSQPPPMPQNLGPPPPLPGYPYGNGSSLGGPGRVPQQHAPQSSAPPPLHVHSHNQPPFGNVEHEPSYFAHPSVMPPPGPAGYGPHGHDLAPRHSPSPVNALASGHKGTNQWVGSAPSHNILQHGHSRVNDRNSEFRRPEITYMDEDEQEHLARERDRRELSDMDRQPDYMHQLQQSHQHRYTPSHQHSHRSGSSKQLSHAHAPHHHHGPHHHHVLHHHPAPRGPSSSPRSNRDTEHGRSFIGPGQHAPEVTLPSKTASWKGDDVPAFGDPRDSRPKHSSRSSSVAGHSRELEDRDRPVHTPFMMGSSHGIHTSPALGPVSNGSASPRRGHPAEDIYRSLPPTGPPPAGIDNPTRSPAHRHPSSNVGGLPRVGQQPSSSRPGPYGLSPPSNRTLPPLSPSSTNTGLYSNSSAPGRSPQRYRERDSGLPPIPSRDRSPPILNPLTGHHRPSSPPMTSKLMGPSTTLPPLGPPTNPASLSGPGRIATPLGNSRGSPMDVMGSGGMGMGGHRRDSSFPSPPTSRRASLMDRQPGQDRVGERDMRRASPVPSGRPGPMQQLPPPLVSKSVAHMAEGR